MRVGILDLSARPGSPTNPAPPRVIGAFTDALSESLPAETRAVVERMAKQVQQTHDRVRDLRNQARAAAK